MKVSIIGTGRVGSAVAFALVARGLADRLVLVDHSPQGAAGDALDLLHACALGRPADVSAGTLAETAGSELLIMTAAKPGAQAHATDRTAFARENAEVLRQVIPELARLSPQAVLLVITNPVDVMTHLAVTLSGFPAARVIGTGTLLDTARFRVLLSERLGVHPQDIRAYILGEHGETQFPVLSSARVGGARVDQYLDQSTLAALFDKARFAGHEIVRQKGHTSYGVALAAAMIVEAVASNGRVTLPVSTLVDDYHGVSGVCISVPSVIGRGGVQRTLRIDLNAQEVASLHYSAAVVRTAYRAIAG